MPVYISSCPNRITCMRTFKTNQSECDDERDVSPLSPGLNPDIERGRERSGTGLDNETHTRSSIKRHESSNLFSQTNSVSRHTLVLNLHFISVAFCLHFSRYYCIFSPKLSFEARLITFRINYPSWIEFETDEICEFLSYLIHIRRTDHGFVLSRGNNSATLNMAAMPYVIISTKRKRKFKDNLILEAVRAKTSCPMLRWCVARGYPKQPANQEKKTLKEEETILPQLEWSAS